VFVHGDKAMAENDDAARRTKWPRLRAAVWIAAAVLLLLPAIAMQFTQEVQWDESDFLVFGGMLLIACVAYEAAARIARSNNYLAAAAIAIGAGFFLVWANLAVGIIGNEEDPLNLMFFGVLVVGMLGALIVRLRPRGMARTLVAMAIAQGLVAVIAQIAGHFTWVFATVYAAIWLVSAGLFREAARTQDAANASR
jgi:hypothetical protein